MLANTYSSLGSISFKVKQNKKKKTILEGNLNSNAFSLIKEQNSQVF